MNESPPPSPGNELDDAPGGQLWRRTLWTMVGVQFVMSMAFSIVSPIMPLFLPDLGVNDESAINLWAGVLASATSFVAIFTAPIWGGLADRYGRKLMVLRSTFGIAVFTALMAIAVTPWQMLALRAGMGALAGFNSAATVLVASQVPERRLGASLGWLSTGQLVGSLVGPVIGGGLADITGSYRIPFVFAGVLCAAAFAGTWGFVPERFTRPEKSAHKAPVWAALPIVARSAGLLPVVLVMLMGQFATQAVQPVVTLYVRQMLQDNPAALDHLATLGGFAFSVTGLAGVIAVPLLGRRSDTIGYRRILLLCLGGAALFTAPQAIQLGYGAFVAERFGLGLFVGSVLPAANALVGRLTPPEHRGLVYGVISSAYFIGNTLGPLSGGAVAATAGLHWVFALTACLLCLNLVWVWAKVPPDPD